MVNCFLLNLASDLGGRKWRGPVFYALRNGPLRYSQIKREIPGIAVKVLSEVLKDLQERDLIIRNQYNTIPVKVTYEIHPEAFDIVETLDTMILNMARMVNRNPERFAIWNPKLIDDIGKLVTSR